MIELKRITPDCSDAEIAAEINNEAFPPLEHIDLEDMFRMNEICDADLFGFYDGEKLVGFIWAVSNKRCVYIFLLAIAEQYRGRGYGTQAIQALFRFYSDKQVVLDFEEIGRAHVELQSRI